VIGESLDVEDVLVQGLIRHPSTPDVDQVPQDEVVAFLNLLQTNVIVIAHFSHPELRRAS